MLTVEHRNFLGETQAVFENPAGLSWTYQIAAKGVGKIEYVLSESDPGVTTEGFAPKRTDVWLLDDTTPLIAGPMWGVNLPLTDDLIKIVANDWLQWLDQPPLGLWDFVGDNATIEGVITSGVVTELVQSFADMGVTNVGELVNALIQTLTFDPTTQVALYVNQVGSAFSEEVTGFLRRTAAATVLSMLNEIAQMGAPFGFDMWASPDTTIEMVGPRRTDPSSASPEWTFTKDDIVEGEWANNGPVATEVLFTDGPPTNGARFWHKEYLPSIELYRRWGTVANVNGGDSQTFQVGGADEGDFKAQASQYRLLFPQHELPITVRAGTEDTFPLTNQLMKPVAVDIERIPGGYWHIDAPYWITSQTYRQADEGSGDWLCDLTLDRIYVPIDD